MSRYTKFNRKKYKSKRRRFVPIICGALVLVLLLGAFATLFSPSKTKELSNLKFSRGGINALGNPTKSDLSIYTKEMFECSGLVITPDDDSELKYQVFYYDAGKNFLSSTEFMTESYVRDNPYAKYARIVVVPTGEETTDKNFKISLLDVYTYADQITVTIDRVPNSVWTEIKRPAGTYSRIRDCIYTGEYWITVGLNGEVSYSTDAKQWIVSKTSFDGQCTGIEYGNGKYVVVDYDNGIYVSDKVYGGYECKLEVTGIEGIAYSGKTFLAVGKEGKAYTSEDGMTWTSITSFTKSDLCEVIYANGQFVVVGQEGCIFASSDLKAWYDYSIDTMSDIRTVSYDGTCYFIGGYEGKIMVSANLSDWKEAVSTSSSNIRYVRDIVVHDEELFAATYSEDGKGEIWVSLDGGFTWNVLLTANSRLWICESGDGKLVVGGDNGRIFVME